MRALVERCLGDGPSSGRDRGVVVADPAGRIDGEFERARRRRVRCGSMRREPLGVLAWKQLIPGLVGDGLDQLECCGGAPFGEQLRRPPDRLLGEPDVDLDARRKLIAGRRGADDVLIAAADRGKNAAQAAHDAAQRDLPRGGEFVRPDHRCEPVCGHGLRRKRERDERNAGATATECLAADDSAAVAHGHLAENVDPHRRNA